MAAAFTLTSNDELPDNAAFFGVGANVACRGFSGHTSFVVARRDVLSFLAAAADLQSGVGDSAQLLGGWDAAEERLRLRIARDGLSARYVVRVRLAGPVPSDGQWDRVETEFVTAPRALAVFLSDLAQLVAQRESRSASLTDDVVEAV